MAFSLGGILGGGAVPDVQMPDGLPVSGGQGSPLVDAFLALQAKRIQDAVTAPRDAYSGDLQVFGPDGHPTDEAMGRAAGMAGLAMTGSMPFKAPAGAIRSFGGGESLDDLLASMSSAIDQHAGSVAPDVRPIGRVDPKAASWDLYHGTDAPTDFARFDTNLPKSSRGHTPSSETGAVFLSPAADEAAQYSGSIGGRPGAEAGPRVIRATVDPGKTDMFDLPYLMEHDPSFIARARQTAIDDAGGRPAAGQMFDERHARMLDDFQSARDLNKQLVEMGYPATEIPQVQWGYGATGAAMRLAKERGLDTAVLRGLSESNGGDQVVALTPGRVRSYYDPDHVLYSGGPAGALAGLPALASSSDLKGSPVSAGPAPGAPSMLDGLSPDMIARLLQAAQAQQPQQPQQAGPSPVDSLLFDRQGMGAPDNGFSGSSGTVLGDHLPQPAQPQAPQPQTTGAIPPGPPQPAPPQAPAPQDGDASAPTGPVAGAVSPTLPPARPPGFGAVGATPPAPAPTAAASAAAPAIDGSPGLLSRLGDPRVYNTLLGLSAGLLSGKNLADGLGQGISAAQKFNAAQGATDLASAKAQAELAKQQREVAAQNQTAKIISQKMGIPLDDATALAMNPAYVQGFLSSQFGAQDGRVRNADGTMSVVQGSAQDPGQIAAAATAGRPTPDQTRATAQAQAEGTAAGSKDDIALQEVPGVGLVAVNKDNVLDADPAKRAAASGVVSATPGARIWGQPGPDGQIVQPPPGTPPGTPGAYDEKGMPHVALTQGTNQLANHANEMLDNDITKSLSEGRQKALGAVGTLAAIGRQKQAIDRGLISGWGSDWRTQAQALGAQLLGIDPAQLNESYNFDAASTQKQAELAKAISQSGHTTNMDLQLGKTIAGGDRGKTEAAIRQIVDAQELLARDAIAHQNADVDRYGKISPDASARAGFYRVDVPDVYRYGQAQPNPVADPGSVSARPQQAAPAQASPEASAQAQQMPAVSPIEAARAAIAAGADPNKVKTRLLRNGIDIRGL